MKTVKPIIYEKLTAQQRVIASIEALARDDEEEKERLKDSCPQYTYKMTDNAYSGKMRALYDIAMVSAFDMHSCALNFFLWLLMECNLKGKQRQKLTDQIPCQITSMISVRHAWHEVLKEEGIAPATMDKAYSVLSHFAIEYMLSIADQMELEPDYEEAEQYKQVLKEYLDRV